MKQIYGIAVVSSFLLFVTGCSEADSPAAEEKVITESDGPTIAESDKYSIEYSSKFDIPWPTEITRQELVNTALYNSYAFLDSIAKQQCAIEAKVRTGDPLLTEHVAVLNEVTVRMVNTFCDYLSEDFYVIGGRYEFVEEIISTENISTRFARGCQKPPENSAGSACAHDGVAWTGISLGAMRSGVAILEERRLTIAAHEIFHIIQDQMDPDPGGQSPPRNQEHFRAVWFIEGGGEFFGRLMPYYFGLINSYGTFVPTDRSGLFLEKEYLGNLQLMEIRRSQAGGVENYYSGQIALEYIAASVGTEAVFSMLAEMGRGLSFDEALSSSIGLTTPEFYEKFQEMHTNLYSGTLATNE